MNPNSNPIAAALGLAPASEKRTLTIGGRGYELYPRRANAQTFETLYRVNPGYGHPNAGFTLAFVPAGQEAMVLGQYLADRDGVKRSSAEAIVAAARAELTAAA